MKRKSILAAGLWVLGLGSAIAADVTLGTAIPPVGAGVQHLSFSTDDATNTDHAFVASDYLGNHNQGLQVGQSFTTGSNVGGYLLTAISVRQVSWTSDWDYTGGNVTLRVFDSSGGFSPSVELVSQTAVVGGEDDGVGATVGGTPTAPMWLTFTLDAPIALDPDKLYSFVLSSDGTSGNDGFFMNLDGTSDGNVYLGGSSITVDATNNLWWGNYEGDRTFVAAMTVPSVPTVPAFEQQPQPDYYIGYVGDNVTLSATAIGDPEPTYQWEYSADGGSTDPWTEIAGETSSMLNIPSAEYADNGFYRVVATNTNGSTDSNPAELSLIYPNPGITQQPETAAVLEGGTATFSVTATGLGNLSYEWYKVDVEGGDVLLVDGGNISGATTAALMISGVSAADEGEYYVWVSDDAGEVDEGYPTYSLSENASLVIGSNLASVGTDTPLVGDGVQNLNFSTDDASNTQHNNVPNDYIGSQYRGDILQMGQSFTTGADAGYLLNSISVRQVAWGPTDWDYDGGFLTLRIFDLSATGPGPVWNGVELASEVAVIPAATSPTIDSAPTAPIWLTFALSEPLALNPNTLYAFAISASGGVGNEGFFMNLDGTATDSYAGGFSLTVDTTAALYDGGNGQPSDRAFVANMDSTGPPANDFASWIGGYDVGGMTGFTQDPDFDGISSGVENFFGTAPDQSSTGVSEVTRTGADTFTFQHPQNATPASDVVASYRWSLDLVNWVADGVESGGTTVSFATSTDAGITTVTATVTGSVPQKVFADIEVKKTDP